LEVHTQFGEIRTIKDFLIRLLLIVAGVVIAVMVTQWREKSQRETLAGQMKTRLIAEVSKNDRLVEEALKRNAAAKKSLDAAVELCKSQVGRTSVEPAVFKQLDEINVDLRTPSLVSTQWKLANANQSIRDFSIDEATQFSGAYSFQDAIEAILLQHKAPLIGTFVDTDAIRPNMTAEELQRACRAITYMSFYNASTMGNLEALRKAYATLLPVPAAAQ
jgi:hypothetical protein